MLNLIRLVIQLIKSPVKTIKGPEIISYDKDAMLRLFIIVSSIYFILPSLLRYKAFNLGATLLFIFLGPVILFLFYNITAVLYYMFFKMFGKGIGANYDSIKTVLYPLFLTMMILNVFASLIIQVLPITSQILQNVVSLWFYSMTFLLLRYKLKQSITRSVVISLVPLFIGIALRFLIVVFNM